MTEAIAATAYAALVMFAPVVVIVLLATALDRIIASAKEDWDNLTTDD